MSTVYVPYSGNNPAAIEIKGHRLLILTSVREDIERDLRLIGGSEVRSVDLVGNENEALANLAASIGAGVILAPPGIDMPAMLKNLERELPWVH